MAEGKQTLTAKLVGLIAALVAAWVAQRLINALWTRTLGHRPPKPEDEGDVPFGEIAAAATISAAVVALARVLATRGVTRLAR